MRAFLLWAALLVAVDTAGASTTGVYGQLTGPRSTSMGGAHRAVGTSNDTLLMNPAGVSAARRYSIDFNYGYSPFDRLSHLSLSALDSQSGPVGGGLAYVHDFGDNKGVDASLHRFVLATSYAIGDWVAIGISNKYVTGSYRKDGKKREVSLYTGDVGIMALLPAGFGVGVTYNNVLRTKDLDLTPPILGTGLAFVRSIFTVTADINFDFTNPKQAEPSYHAGAELLLGDAIPLRAGYARVSYLDEHGQRRPENIISGGLAWVGRQGGVDLAFDLSADRLRNWSLVAGLKLFLL